VHTFSWGSKVMAQCIPWRKDRIVAPDQRNGIGAIRLKDSQGSLAIRAHSAEVKCTDDGFTATMTVDHGSAVRAELQFRSNADGTLVISEKLTALKDCTTADISTGLIAILNSAHRKNVGRTAHFAPREIRPSHPASQKTTPANRPRRMFCWGAWRSPEIPTNLPRLLFRGLPKIRRGRWERCGSDDASRPFSLAAVSVRRPLPEPVLAPQKRLGDVSAQFTLFDVLPHSGSG
jgi:hypothetical protein